ncbi:Right handed beta helix region [Actinokineospora alba]|uniref:Right handed beta helix region n=1 Tax=Actinokineospora alba TaxID=504798 RepID=A0A1H0ES53_9PSEU|nr:right-handed parallel beta-helix repeat-containing protein [Actinokineospora alba]TDP69200.1 parallel beta helix pectate lyase-like protein [Actinokineospora alba]SDI22033.1 Right handed beta helix region [Actinokineospora alba]SDN85109.1 Right handed beta helix region [Actinokineospora alba]
MDTRTRWRISRLAVVAAIATTLAAPGSAQAAATTLYAAPTGSGTACTVAAPCSLTGARDKARALLPGGDVVVQLRGGTYRLTSTFDLTAADSGVAGRPAVWQAYPGERPILSGGRQVTGWQVSDAGRGIHRAPVAAGTRARQLFVNGVRADRARTPLNPAGFTKTAGGFATADPKYLGWADPTGVELVARNKWKHLRCPLASITANGTGSSLNAAQPCWGNAGTAPNPDYYFPYNGSGRVGLDTVTWLENAYELLDTAGEFFLDSAAGYVYYIPRAGENLSTATVELPVTETLVRLAGTPGQLVPYNNDDSRISYQGTWGVSGGRTFGDLRDDLRYTQTNGDSSTITFTGTGIDVLSERYSDLGDIDVFVDGVFDRTVSAYRGTDRLAQQVIYSKTGLTQGSHTVRLVKKSGSYLVIDGFVPVTAPIAPVHDIALRGITFAHSAWSQPSGPEGYADNQAGVIWVGSPARTARTPGAVRVERGQRIEVSGGELAHLGGVGVDLAFGTQDSTVIGNRVHDVSGSGISVGEFDDFWLTDPARMTSGNTVSDNAITYVGQEYEDAVGILVGFTRAVTLSHNEIAHTPYSGISLGWGWGWASPGVARHGTNYAQANNITDNYVHDVMRVLSDGGLIYTLGGQGDGSVRSVFSGNALSKATAHHANAQGVYLDEGSSWWDAHSNVVSQTAQNWTMEWINTIHDITIRDNFSDVTRQTNNGTNVTITNTTFVTDGNWPARAKEIATNAGLRPAYRKLMPVDPYLGNDGELGSLLSPATIGYTGAWSVSSGRQTGDLNQDLHVTSANGAQAAFTFTGTGIRVLGERSPDQGALAVSMDGTVVGTVDTYSATRKVQQVIYQVGGLPYGQHTVTLTKQSGTYATIDGYLLDRSVNNNDPTVEYSGTWGYHSGRGFGDYQNDVQYSLANGDSVTATWVGTGVDVVTERNFDQGDLDVYVDGQFRATVSTFASTRQVQQKVFGIDGLRAGVHTVTLVKKSGQYAVVDRFTVR